MAACLLLGSTASFAEDEAPPDFARPGWYAGLGATFFNPKGDVLPVGSSGVTNLEVDQGIGLNAQVGYRLFRNLAVELQARYAPSIDSSSSYGKPVIVCADPQSERCTLDDLNNDSVDGVTNDTRSISDEVQRTTDLLLVTANVKIPLLTGRFQPFVTGGVGFYYDSSTEQPANIGSRVTGELQDAVFQQVNSPTLNDIPGLALDEFGFAAQVGGGVDLYFTDTFLLSFDATWVSPSGMEGLPIDDPTFLLIGLGFQYRFH